jgi:hypothetical protein
MRYIRRYLARKAGLNGTTEKEIAVIDMIMEAVEVSSRCM